MIPHQADTLKLVTIATLAYIAALIAIEASQLTRHGETATITAATRRLLAEYTWLGILLIAVPLSSMGVVLLHIGLGLELKEKRR
jgi:hypothetical protein